MCQTVWTQIRSDLTSALAASKLFPTVISILQEIVKVLDMSSKVKYFL